MPSGTAAAASAACEQEATQRSAGHSRRPFSGRFAATFELPGSLFVPSFPVHRPPPRGLSSHGRSNLLPTWCLQFFPRAGLTPAALQGRRLVRSPSGSPGVFGSIDKDATARVLLRNVPLRFAAIRRMALTGRVLSFREGYLAAPAAVNEAAVSAAAIPVSRLSHAPCSRRRNRDRRRLTRRHRTACPVCRTCPRRTGCVPMNGLGSRSAERRRTQSRHSAAGEAACAPCTAGAMDCSLAIPSVWPAARALSPIRRQTRPGLRGAPALPGPRSSIFIATVSGVLAASCSGDQHLNPFSDRRGAIHKNVPTIVGGPTFVAWEHGPSVESDGDGRDDTYGPSDIVKIAVSFSEQVCGFGVLKLVLRSGDGSAVSRNAKYCGCGPSSVSFCYRVKRGDQDSDGLAIPANAILLKTYDGIVPDSRHRPVQSQPR